jgi:PhnB protein
MKLVHFYLNFPGTAEEAFKHYEAVFKTKIISLRTYGETPFAGEVSDADKDKIMNAQLPITENVHLMASDSIPGYGPDLSTGNNFNIVVVADDKAEADRVFDALASGGEITMPIANAPWGPYFGMCRDKFGIQWMVSLDHPIS